MDAGDIADVAVILDDRAVAIEEHGAFHAAAPEASCETTAFSTRCTSMRVMQRWSIRTRPQHARTAKYVLRENGRFTSRRAGQRRGRPFTRWSEHRDDRHVERGRQVHRSRVVRQECGAAGSDAD